MDKLYIIRNIVSPLNTIKANIIVCFDDTMKENREGKNLHCITEADTSNEKYMIMYIFNAHIYN